MRRASLIILMAGLGCATPSEPTHVAISSLEMDEEETPLGNLDKILSLPVITSLTPRTGISGLEYEIDMTLTGRYFDPINNTVMIIPHPETVAPFVVLSQLSDQDGTRIAFELPKCLPLNQRPCFVLGSGDYDVTVTTVAGRSNAVLFTLCVPWISPTFCLLAQIEWKELM